MIASDHALEIPVSLVVIGRNEGERLRGCLESLQGQGGAVVYVDSGSTDGSREVARSLGAGCTLRQGVTIGNKVEHGPVPVIEDNVEFGAYAQVLGDIRIGQGAKIGAMSVVLQDVPAGHTAVGIPARIVSPAEGRGA